MQYQQQSNFRNVLLFPLLGFSFLHCKTIEEGELYPGGETTNTFLQGSNAFILPAENMLIEHEPSFYTGNSFFNQAWVETPSSTQKRDGIGPLFNARSCASCHFKDGRGAPPEDGETFLGLLLRISIDGSDVHGRPNPSPGYGTQIQPFSILNVETEAAPTLKYEEIEGTYGDGTSYFLLKPSYEIKNLAYGELSDEIMISPRIAPMVIGMGLLESIPLSRLEELEDIDDVDDDGISGKINRIWNPVSQSIDVGRFGWKSEAATVRHQVAEAFLGDIGITNPILGTNNCASLQDECREQPNGGEPEIEEDLFNKVVLYSSLLAVPMRRKWDSSEVASGKSLFNEIGCEQCHTSTHVTSSDSEFSELHNQKIWPYTDLLLHDMGEGLADNRPVFLANGSEWKTPPLWSLGLIESVNKHTRFLHDGRARNLAEAILWHGGEGEDSKERFRNLSLEERENIISFIKSL